MEKHELVIESMHDLIARCTCGRWRMVSLTSPTDTDLNIRIRAEQQHREHVRRHTMLKNKIQEPITMQLAEALVFCIDELNEFRPDNRKLIDWAESVLANYRRTLGIE